MKISNRIVRFALVSTTATFMTMVGALATTPVVATASSVSMVMDAELAVESQAGSAALNLAPLDADGRRLYVVRLHEPSLATYEGGIRNLAPTSPRATGASRLDVRAPASQAYLDHLSGRHADVLQALAAEVGRNVEPAFTYLNVLNAMAVNLTPAEARRVAGLPGVRSVNPDRIMELETDVGPALIGAPALWDGVNLPGLETRGEGVVVGIIDTGINSQHPAFAETDMDGYTHTNPYGSGNFVGWCDTDDPTFCNDKLIGAWSFNPVGGNPEDDHNHGSHVGSTAAGNRHVAAYELGGQTFNLELSGVAPRANVIGYKVCSPGCPNTASVAAVNQGIADGVDILNYSISGSDNPWNDIVDQAFLDAFAANVFVAASAGNDGPGPSTVAKTGPWNAAVAASTHSRIFANILNLTGGPQDVAAVPGTGPDITATYVGDLRWAGDVDAGNAEGCNAFPANSFDGEAALISRGGCTFATKVNNAVAAGADFVVAYNHVGGPPIAMGGLEPTTVPAVMVDNVAGADLIAALGGGTAEVEVEVNVDLFDEAAYADVMGGFSSRGPSQFDLMAPTFSAPGVNILAAGRSVGGDPDQWYQSQGTSMSSPHAAGAAALVRGLHPGWSPAEIRSAMSLSADPDVLIKEDGLTPADPFDQGSGRLDLSAAGRLTLVMDETTANFEAANPDTGGDPRTLNVPHLIDQNCAGGCSWTRTVTHVGDDELTYEVSASGPAGMDITVTPSSFTLDTGQSETLTIDVDVDLNVLPEGAWAFAEIAIEPQSNTAANRSFGDFFEVGEAYDFDGTWAEKTHDISSLAGEEVCFAFRFEGTDSHAWYIDDVLITSDAGTHLDESFDDATFPPSGWDIYELGSTPQRQWARTTASFNTAPAAAWHNWNGADFHDDNWLVTPSMTLGDNPELTYFDRMTFISFYEYSGIWASTGSCSPTPVVDESTARMPIAIIPFDDAPALTLDPESMASTQEPGVVVEQTLLIGNEGLVDLEWNTSEALVGVVLVENPQNGTSGIVADYFEQSDGGTYSADVFTLARDATLTSIHAPGFWNGGDLANATAINWYIYPDDNGQPAGHPEDGNDAHLWTYSAAPGSTGVDVSDNDTLLDIVAALGDGIDLDAGSYWLAVFPDIDLPFGGDRWNWYQGAGGSVQAHLVDPNDFFGGGFTSWTSFGTLGLSFQNVAFRLEGDTECELPAWLSISPTSGTVNPSDQQDVTVTYDSTGLATGTYTADICIETNDAENPVVEVPVTLTVSDPAEIEVTPGSLEGTVNIDDATNLTLDIANQGVGELSWSIDTAEMPAATVAYGVHQPQLAQSVVSPQGWNRDAGTTPSGSAQPFPAAAILGGPIEELDEGFDDVTVLPGAGWSLQNLSDPLGTSDWFQGNDGVFGSHQGAANSYIGANFNNTSGVGTISNWLITPEMVLRNGTELRFWTRRTGSQWEDRLEVRLSSSGDSTDVGTGAGDVGDFDTLLLSINENLEPGGYPAVWTEFVVEVSGLPEATTGRFSMRYYVTNAGPSGDNSDYIGIDTLSISQPPVGCDAPETVSWLSVDPDSGVTSAGDVSSVDVTLDADGLAEGEYQALLCVNSNDPANPLVEVPVTMTVVDQDPAELGVSPTELAFGEIDLGDDATQSFTVSNVAASGAMSLELSTLALSGDGEFAITGGDCAVGTELAPGEDCSVEVTFTPSAADNFSGSVAVATTDEQSVDVTLSGEGVQDPAVLDVDPTDLAFGEVDMGADATLAFTVTNATDAGAASLELSTLELSGDAEFAITGGNCAVGTVLEAGEFCDVEVTFTPSAEATFSGAVAVATTDGDSETVVLSGQGVELPDDIFSDRFELQD